MCYRVECRSCGKYTWGGCGKHLKSLYAKIEEGNHCMCQSWPGVVIRSQASSASSTDQPSQPATSAQDFYSHERQQGLMHALENLQNTITDHLQ